MIRLGILLGGLGVLGGGGFLFVGSPVGQALVGRARHLGWNNVHDSARQIDARVRACVVSFLATPTPLPTEPPAPSPTPRPTATLWPTEAPDPEGTPTPRPGQAPAESATPDLSDQVLRDYLAALNQGDRIRALNDWADPRETTATALIDAALKRGEHYQVTTLVSRPSPLDPGLRQVDVTANVTVGNVTTPSVHLLYQLQLFQGEWKITARLE